MGRDGGRGVAAAQDRLAAADAVTSDAHAMRPRELITLLGLRRPQLDPVRRRLARCHDVEDLRALARRRMPGAVFDYADGGADEELSLARNRAAFRAWEFTPRALRDVSGVDPGTMLLGAPAAMPLALAPTGYTRMLHPQGERAVARAAARAGLPYALSTVASTSLEDVAAAAAGRRWFGLYVWRDREVTADLVARAWRSGYDTLEVSVDVAVPGLRRRDVRHGLTIPPRLTARTLGGILTRPGYWLGIARSPRLTFANVPSTLSGGGFTIQAIGAQFDPSLTWEDVAAVRAQWPGRLLVKGPLRVEDAVRAVELGADGVHLSNHGGRQLDRVAPPVDAVAPVRAALGDGATIVVDSGVLHGADVAVAIALGADAAAIGRAYLYGLMAAGEAGVEHALRLLRAQFERTLQLLGVASVAELRADGARLVRRAGS